MWLCAEGEAGLKVGGADLSCLENDKFTFQKCPCLFGVCKILIRKQSSEGEVFVSRRAPLEAGAAGGVGKTPGSWR